VLRRARFRLTNRSGYDTEDLRAFFARGLSAMRVRTFRHILVVAAPQRSRGCAEVGHRGTRRDGRVIVIAIAPPSRFSIRRLARLFVHEASHTLGAEHEDMPDHVLYSLGATPRWAYGLRIRYRGRAPNQL